MTLPSDDSLPREASDGPRKFRDLHKTITMAQIAKAAGVSQGAISSLLNDRDYGIRVSEKTRERVFKVCREMGYIPNDLRAVVRMYPELGEYCLLISSRLHGLTDPVVARIAYAAMNATAGKPISLTLATYDEGEDYLHEPDRFPHPLRSGVASKFLNVGTPNKSLVQAVIKRGLPIACIGYDTLQPGVLSTVPDYQQASQIALGYLFQLGHRDIAIVSGPFGTSEPHINELNRGVSLACEAMGIRLEAHNIIYGDLSFEAGSAAFESLQDRKPRPTAIFCMSDDAAAGVMAAAHSKGCAIPKDLSVLGCSNHVGSTCTSPPLTTIHLPIEEMAQLAVREVDALVQRGLIGDARRIVLPVQLIERQSCGVPAGED